MAARDAIQTQSVRPFWPDPTNFEVFSLHLLAVTIFYGWFCFLFYFFFNQFVFHLKLNL
jgi:hypothetical protein